MVALSRRWGGRRIHDLDDGGLWLSDEAGKRRISGVLEGGGGCLSPARRTPEGGPLASRQPLMRVGMDIVRSAAAPATGRRKVPGKAIRRAGSRTGLRSDNRAGRFASSKR